MKKINARFIKKSISSLITSVILMYFLFKTNDLFNHIYVTLYETIISFLIASIVGFILASILWWNEILAKIGEKPIDWQIEDID